MPFPSVIQGDVAVQGQLSAQTMVIPAGSIGNTAIAAGSSGDFIAASKSEHQFPISYAQLNGADVEGQTSLVHVVRGKAALVAVRAAVAVPAAGGDKAVVVDVKYSRGGAAAASLLSSPLTLNSATAALTAVAATLAGTQLLAGDVVSVVVTVSGTTGTQAQGLLVSICMREEPS